MFCIAENRDQQKMVSKEFTQRTEVQIPNTLTLSELRRSITSSAPLFVVFSRADGSADPLAFIVGDKTYTLIVGVTYVVNSGGETDGLVFLNPLREGTGAAAESNIPITLDEIIASNQNINRTVWTTNDEIIEIVDRARQLSEFAEYTKEFVGFTNRFQNAVWVAAKSYLPTILSLKCESGLNLQRHLSHLLSFSAEEQYIQLRAEGKNSNDAFVETEQKLTFEIVRFLDTLEGILVNRLQQMHSLRKSDEDVVLSLDSFDFRMDSLGPIQILTEVSKRGWSLSVPYSNCPAQAATAFQLAFSGQNSDFKHFNQTLDELQQTGHLLVDKSKQVVVFTGFSLVRSAQTFVFHGDDTALNALLTLSACGDPFLGESVSGLGYILFKHEELQEPVTDEVIEIQLSDL